MEANCLTKYILCGIQTVSPFSNGTFMVSYQPMVVTTIKSGLQYFSHELILNKIMIVAFINSISYESALTFL